MRSMLRLINPNMMVLGQEPRQTTSVLGHLVKPSIQALIHGLNRHYYSIAINYRKVSLGNIFSERDNTKYLDFILTGNCPNFGVKGGTLPYYMNKPIGLI